MTVDGPAFEPDDCPPPRYARVQAASPGIGKRDGRYYPGNHNWEQVLFTEHDCDHQSSMCLGCVGTWLLDNNVELPAGVDFPDGMETAA